MMRRCLPLTCLLLFGCGPTDKPAIPPAVAGAHDGDPQTPEEKAVAAEIAKESVFYSDVKWVRWGPNDLTEQTHFRGPKVKIVRVRFTCKLPRQPTSTQDALWATGVGATDPDLPAHLRDNPDGDDWLVLGIQAKKKQEDAAMQGPHR